jgi:hypothetical protein
VPALPPPAELLLLPPAPRVLPGPLVSSRFAGPMSSDGLLPLGCVVLLLVPLVPVVSAAVAPSPRASGSAVVVERGAGCSTSADCAISGSASSAPTAVIASRYGQVLAFMQCS